MNLLVAVAAWIGISVPVSIALGVAFGRARGAQSATDRLSLPAVSAGRLTRL